METSKFGILLKVSDTTKPYVSAECLSYGAHWLFANPCLYSLSYCHTYLLLSAFVGKCMMTINAHLDYVTAVNFNRDSTLIVSCSLDGLMYVTDVLGLLGILIRRRRLWNTTTGTCLKTLVENGNVIWYVTTLILLLSSLHWLSFCCFLV
jgi:WD40 repeat protein